MPREQTLRCGIGPQPPTSSPLEGGEKGARGWPMVGSVGKPESGRWTPRSPAPQTPLIRPPIWVPRLSSGVTSPLHASSSPSVKWDRSQDQPWRIPGAATFTRSHPRENRPSAQGRNPWKGQTGGLRHILSALGAPGSEAATGFHLPTCSPSLPALSWGLLALAGGGVIIFTNLTDGETEAQRGATTWPRE